MLLIVAVGAGLRFTALGRNPVWLDEALSYDLANRPLNEMWRAARHSQVHPPLYYYLLHATLPLGRTEAILRLPSAVFGVLTIPVAYAIGRTIWNRHLGLLAALLLAVSPLHLYYAQEARMYTLLTLEVALATWGLAWLLRRHSRPSDVADVARDAHPSAIGGDRSRAWAAWLAYVVGSAAALWTQTTSIFWFLGANATVAIWWFFNRSGSQNDPTRFLIRRWMPAQLLVVALWSPWLPAAIEQTRVVSRDFYASSVSLGGVFDAFRDFFAFDAGPKSRILATGAILLLLGLGLWRWRRDRVSLVLALGVLLAAPVGEIVVSQWRPIFLLKTLLWSTLGLFLITCAGLLSIRWRAVRFIALGVLVLGSVSGIRFYYAHPDKAAWRKVTPYIVSNAQPGDLVVLSAVYVRSPFNYYLERSNRELDLQGVNGSVAHLIPDIVRGRTRVWLIYGYQSETDPGRRVQETLGRLGRVVQHHVFVAQERIEVFLYAMRPT